LQQSFYLSVELLVLIQVGHRHGPWIIPKIGLLVAMLYCGRNELQPGSQKTNDQSQSLQRARQLNRMMQL
jgi:hypothetical protein